MDKVYVHPRVMERHTELAEQDVIHTWNEYVRMRRRSGDGDGHVVALGFDGNGRAVEKVARELHDECLVYHAQTPPTAKIIRELGL